MKKVELTHKELNEDCFEVLKSTIIEDEILKIYTIDKNTLINELPEDVVNAFFNFLSTTPYNQITLEMIKKGTLILECS